LPALQPHGRVSERPRASASAWERRAGKRPCEPASERENEGKTGMKISLIASDESTAPLYRVRLLARALARRFEVEVLGYHFEPSGLDPLAPRDFPYRAQTARALPGFLDDARALAEQVSGDVIYAMKPRPTSFGTALLAARKRGLPVLVDLDDWEPFMV